MGLVPPSNGNAERTKMDEIKRAAQRTVVQAFQSYGYRVAIADTVAGFDSRTMLADVVHPNEKGYKAINNAIRGALRQLYQF